MRSIVVRGLALVALAAVAACGGGGGVVPHSTTPQAKKMGNVAFKMTWPVQKSGSKTPKFISPSTASVAVEVNGGTAQVFNSPSAGGVATLNILAPIGTDDFIFTLWDGQNGTGEQLGQAEVSAAVAAGQVTNISAEVEGVVASIGVAPAANQPMVAQTTDSTGHAAFQFIGDNGGTFTLTPMDADGNIIIYPSGDALTPALNLTSLEPNLTIAAVNGNPNQFTVTPSGAFSLTAVSLQATATDDFGVVTTNYPLTQVPVTYVAYQNGGSGTIKAYTNGAPLTLAGSFAGLVNPVGAVYDGTDHLLLVADASAGGGEVLAFDQQGNAASGFTPIPAAGITGLTYASDSGNIYVTANNAVKEFTIKGVAVTYTAGLTTDYFGIAYDVSNARVYIGNQPTGTNGTTFATYCWFGLSGSTGSLGNFAQCNPAGVTETGIAVDAADGYVAQIYNASGTYGIQSYDALANSSFFTAVTTGLNAPSAITYVPSTQEFLVTNSAGNNVTGYLLNTSTGLLTYDTVKIHDASVTQPSGIAVVI